MTTKYNYNGISRYGRFDLLYPSAFFLECKTLSTLNEDLSLALQDLNYSNLTILNQIELNTFYASSTSKTLLEFSFLADTDLNARRFRLQAFKTPNQNSTTFKVTEYDDQNAIAFEHIFQNSIFYDSLATGWTQPQFAISATENSLAIFCTSTNKASPSTKRNFFIGFSKLENVNPNYNFYDALYKNSLCYFHSNNESAIEVRYQLFELTKLAHVEEKTNFPIVCADGRKPTQNWTTNCLVFDNYSELKNPLIGTTSNLFALGWGNFNYGQITKITSGINDENSQFYLPIANYGTGNKTFLMRINSSV